MTEEKIAKLRVIVENGDINDISDKEINEVRESLYRFMCLRRDSCNVIEYKVDNKEKRKKVHKERKEKLLDLKTLNRIIKEVKNDNK